MPAGVDAVLFLTLNGVALHEALVRIEQADVLVYEPDLAATDLLTPGAVRTSVGGQPFVSLRSLGVGWTLDLMELRLDLVADPSLLPGHAIDLRRSIQPADIVHTRDASAFLNYGARAIDFQRVDGYAELGVSVGPARLYSNVTLSSTAWPVRGLTHLTVDLRERRLRLIAGDTFAHGGTLGGGAFLGGLQISRTYQLDPYFIPGPSLDHQTQVLVPSTLEVYVNGQLVRREEVAPGPLDVQNIPLISGAGDTRVVLRDALGRESVVTASYYRPRGLLTKGQQEFTYSAGFQRQGIGVESFDYGRFAAVGTHRLGLTRMVTASARAEVAEDRFSGGAGVVAGVGVGQIEIAGAASTFARLPGGAASVAWSYTSRKVSAAVYGRYLSEHYTNLSIDPSYDRATVETGTSVGVPITRRWTTSAAYAFTGMRDAGPGHRATLSTGYQLPKNVQLGAYGTWAHTRLQPDQFAVHVSVTATFGPRITTVVRGEFSSEGNNAFAEVSRPTPVGNGAGFRVGGRVGDTPQAYAYANAQFPFLRVQGTFDWREDHASGTLGVAGGLVAIGGRVFVTRPVDSAYALLRVPGVAGVQTFLNNNPMDRTDRHGDAIVLGLLPYYGNRLSISDEDVPLDHGVLDTELVIAPPARSGAIVVFPVSQLQLVRGRIQVSVGEAAYGDVFVNADGLPLNSPIGVDGSFEIDGLGEGSWTGMVRYSDGSCLITLLVPPSNGPVIDLGDLPCTPPPPPEGP